MKNKTIPIVLVVLLSAFTALAQTTQFSYQGSLKDGGNSVNGNYDFEFVLYGALLGGTQLGPTNALNNVAVTNGIFSVYLDFGNQFSAGNSRWLEIRTRPAGQPGFTILAPRQPLATVPYAWKSQEAATAGSATTAVNALQLGGVAANQFVQTGDARLSDARDPLPNSPNYIQNTLIPQNPGNFYISGTGLANIFNAATQYNLGGSRVLSKAGLRNLFAGEDAGIANTGGFNNAFFGYSAGKSNAEGSGNAFFGYRAGLSNGSGTDNSFFGSSAGLNNIASGNSFFGMDSGSANNTGGFNSFFGERSGWLNTTGEENTFFGSLAGKNNGPGSKNAFFGRYAGFSNTIGGKNTIIGAFADVLANNLANASAIGSYAAVSEGNSLVLGSINGVNGATADTNVGIGTTAPNARLNVVGQTLFNNAYAAGLPIFTRGLVNLVTTTGNADLYMQGGGTSSGINFGVAPTLPNATLYLSQYDGISYQDRLVINKDGNVGIGNAAPNANAKLQVSGSVRVTNGGIFVAQPNTLIITSPNGACWGLTVNNSGVLSTFSTPCP